MSEPPGSRVVLHASAVAFGPAGLLIVGRSGAGKSSLALELMALGADLVADDRVVVDLGPDGALRLSAPDAIRGAVEARGLGLLAAPAVTAIARGVVDLDQTETRRLPEAHDTVILGVTLPRLAKVESPAFPAMLVVWLKGGRIAP